MPHDTYELDGLTVLHVPRPVDGGAARVVTGLVRAQVRSGTRLAVMTVHAAHAAGGAGPRRSARPNSLTCSPP